MTDVEGTMEEDTSRTQRAFQKYFLSIEPRSVCHELGQVGMLKEKRIERLRGGVQGWLLVSRFFWWDGGWCGGACGSVGVGADAG